MISKLIWVITIRSYYQQQLSTTTIIAVTIIIMIADVIKTPTIALTSEVLVGLGSLVLHSANLCHDLGDLADSLR